ncbi:MAG: DUF763 domain-containing protein [Candidatus Methanomethylicota archaeon]|uniref:DUF763 domain-containing protein n=1 Tax=Thermoproteota archaeon TaxID=2056631 RepID=A0A497ERV6_9CREN|nr:MAG: DUF763 domain-containing protein [Candidatus Verstraetearchaeota archaeon]
MKKTGIAELPLHTGWVPRWLFNRMEKLAYAIVAIIIEEHGAKELLRRLADPFWFQAFGNVLGFDWHSSGLTTVVTSALKEALGRGDLGVLVCGGKGKASKRTPIELEVAADKLSLSEDKLLELKYASRMSAKVDNVAIQAGYPLYHHVIVVTEEGDWAVIQQGMNARDKTARRYHWLSEKVQSFVNEPHTAIVGDVVKDVVLDMTARESEGARKVSVDLVKEKPDKIQKIIKALKSIKHQTLLTGEKPSISYLSMPMDINWDALKRAYEFQPRNYEELLGIRGIGASTVRGLALISEIVYGEKPSWRDPVKYSFAFGGKDGVPYPVDRVAMDEAIRFLMATLESAKIEEKERLEALKRLRVFVPETKA